ncbi:hypothetical protein V6N13_100462 [Hibiscus sabdariffa]
MAMFLNFLLVVMIVAPVLASRNPVNFYKLSLQWPRSTCSDGRVACPQHLPPAYNTMFTIHGIWPQDANDESVDPYNGLSHPCTWNPTPANNIQKFLTPIYSDLNTLWPDLKDPLNPTANRKFWRKEWGKHGKCSDYPQNPLEYFDSALRLRQNLLVPDFGLQPGVQYSVKQVEQMVKNVVNGYPEIACNKNIHTGVVQLWEIRLCYDRPTPHQLIQNIRNCPRSTHSNSGARGLCANTMITLP